MQIEPSSPSGSGSPGLGVDDLHDERVLEDVQPVVRRALHRHPLHLVEAVRVEALDAERRLEQLAVADVRQRAELEVGRGVVAHLARDVGEAEQVVAGGEDGGGLVLDRELAPAVRCS